MTPDRDDDKGFTVTDRRHFTGEGEPSPAEHDEAPAAAPPPAAPGAAPPPPAAPPAVAPPPAATPPPAAEAARPAAEAPAGGRARRPAPLPEIDFPTFILSLGTSALYHLGEVPGPDGKSTEQNLPLAKQTIDILALLREKTKGNLGPDEAQLLDSLLYDLRMKYVAAPRK